MSGKSEAPTAQEISRANQWVLLESIGQDPRGLLGPDRPSEAAMQMAEAKLRELDAAQKEASTPAPDVRPDGKDRFKVFDAEHGFCGTVEIDSTITVVWLAVPLRGERRRFSQREHAVDYLRLVRKLTPKTPRRFGR